MGYGKVLKEILDEKQMSVKTLSRNTGVPAPTIYSIIRRDTPIRYDTALRFANTLDIPLATICNENPYNEEDKSLPEVGKLVGMSDQRSKKAYLSNRTSAIFTKFDYSDLPKVDQLIADFFVLDDMTREELFEYITLHLFSPLKDQMVGKEYEHDLEKMRTCVKIIDCLLII